MSDVSQLTAWVRGNGGIAHSSSVRAAGFTPHHVTRAIAMGSLQRIRRSWLAVPDCHPQLVAAATQGGRLTCVSAAGRLGLWTPDHVGLHIAVPPHGSRRTAPGFTLHWARPPVPSIRSDVHEHVLNVLFHVARCLDPTSALALWESAIRRRVVEKSVLERVHWRSSRASDLVRVVSAASDAGTETQFCALMRLAGVSVRQQVWLDGHPVDGLIGERLAVQIDGFAHHSSPADRRRDLKADARLALRGFTVLRFDYQQVFFDSSYVVDTVLTAMAQRRHVA